MGIRTGQILYDIIAISMQNHRLQIAIYSFENVITMRGTSMLQNALYYTATVQIIAHVLHRVSNASK